MQPIDVAAALVWKESRLLIAQRPPGSHLAGLWEFPGGKREGNESWEECLRRELREELCVEVEVLGFHNEVVFEYPATTVRLRFYAARLLAGEPRPVGCAEVKWVAREELRTFCFPAADAEIIDDLANRPELWRD